MAVILSYKTQVQILNEWCWAAVASSISFKYNPTGGLTQSALAGNLIDLSCASVSPDDPASAPDICDQEYDLGQALLRIGNLSRPFDGYLAYSALCAEIDNGRPVCCQIFWADYQKSHYITLFGYVGSNIVIGDPDQDAGVCSLDYDELIGGYRTGKWTRSFYTKPTN